MFVRLHNASMRQKRVEFRLKKHAHVPKCVFGALLLTELLRRWR